MADILGARPRGLAKRWVSRGPEARVDQHSWPERTSESAAIRELDRDDNDLLELVRAKTIAVLSPCSSPGGPQAGQGSPWPQTTAHAAGH